MATSGRLSDAGLETLARIAAVGSCSWYPGKYANAVLADAWHNTLNARTVANLVRDGYLVATGNNHDHVLSPAAVEVLSHHLRIRGIAATFYEQQAVLAQRQLRAIPDSPDFGRSVMSREVRIGS